MERTLRHLVDRYRVDGVQMHDMDFFISEARVAEFAERITGLGLGWWALGRVDTLMQYSDGTWQKLARSGLKMVFSGAESGTDEALARMNKGGKAAASLTLQLARRMREYGVVPEFSFVLGSPPDPLADVASTFEFIRRIKRINPATEIVRSARASPFPKRCRSGRRRSGNSCRCAAATAFPGWAGKCAGGSGISSASSTPTTRRPPTSGSPAGTARCSSSRAACATR
jgi:radical SAM superfamily enzyme YgiQ (UPF0313 family)